MPTRAERDRWGCGGAREKSRATRARGKSWRRGNSGRATAGSCCPVPARERTSGPDAREDKTPEALPRWKGKYWRPSTSSLQRPLWLTRSSCWWWVSLVSISLPPSLLPFVPLSLSPSFSRRYIPRMSTRPLTRPPSSFPLSRRRRTYVLRLRFECS